MSGNSAPKLENGDMHDNLRQALYRLRHEEPAQFAELISKMVEELAQGEFSQIAKAQTSWPVNVPVRRKLNRKPGHEPPRRERTREEWTDFVLDRLLEVGSAVYPNPRKRKGIDLENPYVSLAVDSLHIISAVRNRPLTTAITKKTLNLADEVFDLWAENVRKLGLPVGTEKDRWCDAAYELAQMRFGKGLERDPRIHAKTSSTPATVLRTKTSRGRQTFHKKYFRQALLPLL